MNKELEAFKRIWALFDFKDMQYERSLVIKALTELEDLKTNQTKVTKLLELYRERKEFQNYRGEHPEEYYEVDKQITEIEEELKWQISQKL